jgi:hypothetical protein
MGSQISACTVGKWLMFSCCLHQIGAKIVVLVCRFKLPYPDQVLGLPTGQHITLKYVNADGEDVLKPYTPITDDDTVGHVDFVIKVRPRRASSNGPFFADMTTIAIHLCPIP